MRALGLDVGSRTIGLATGDLDAGFAAAREVLRRQGTDRDVRAVVERIQSWDVREVVVGLPLELDGRVGHRARRVQAFVDALELALPEGVGCQPWDERFSTAAAERTLIEGGVSRRRRKDLIDAMAAQHILQGWLDARARDRDGHAAQDPGGSA